MSGNAENDSVCHCHYHRDLIVVRRENVGEALEFIIQNVDDGAVELDEGEFYNYIDGLSGDELGTIIELIALIRVSEPHVAASELFNTGFEASPIHGLGFMGHGGFKGDDFEVAPGSVHPDVESSTWDQVIAVVDSGLAPEEDLPAWMSAEAGVLTERPQDTELLTFKNPVSHGTFVTSVIRRLAPDFVVSVASARPDPGYMVTDEEPHLPSTSVPTDELNVFGALVRLVKRHREGPGVVALNLALGAHDCPGGGMFLMSMRIALDHWKANFPEAVIFAAGGNSTCPEPVYPAAWDDIPVRAVGATADGGEPLVWADKKPVPDQGRGWITDWAPGNQIQGLSGQNSDQVIRWSGSSFACAVAAACYANGAPSTIANGQTWWPDEYTQYASIPNLVFHP